MNYEANTTHWRKGDIVIHDADAKEPKMLMRVMGFTRDGLCKTQYVDDRRRRTILKNEIIYLHSPKHFGINPEWGKFKQDILECVQNDWERVRQFNHRFWVGTPVKTTSADGGFITTTKGKAYMDSGGSAYVNLTHGGNWLLEFIETYPEGVL